LVVRLALVIYVAGVFVGLWRVDESGWRRAALALVWPLGLLAAAVTTPLLLTGAAVRFPLFGVVMAALLAAGWWVLM
jgi:hypothetical protein